MFRTVTETLAESPNASVGYALWLTQREWNDDAAIGTGPPAYSR